MIMMATVMVSMTTINDPVRSASGAPDSSASPVTAGAAAAFGFAAAGCGGAAYPCWLNPTSVALKRAS